MVKILQSICCQIQDKKNKPKQKSLFLSGPLKLDTLYSIGILKNNTENSYYQDRSDYATISRNMHLKFNVFYITTKF